mmetsp:Transcript_7516/g.12527  ORF Transcript_7516/g.12527 Transcript_7516/m.12527 type:complete len:373 (+) Transcript_7516:98-1216(+)
MTLDKLDKKIVRKREELRKFRDDAIIKREIDRKKLEELETKKAQLEANVRHVLKKGVELAVFAQIMQEANDKRTKRGDGQPPHYNSITFGHEVLLLNTVHMMEVHEQLLRICVGQGKKLAKFVERRKITLREQNSEYVIRTVNKLSKYYGTMKKLEDDYRQAIQSQQVYIAKMEWKTNDILLPMPTLSATASEFIRDKRDAIFVNPSASSRSLNNSGRVSVDWAKSMRNLMEMDGAFPAPDQDDLLPTINRRNTATSSMSDESAGYNDRPPMEFIAVLGDGSNNGSVARQQPPRRTRRISRADSVDTMSTAGEEMLQGIQDFFFRGRRGSDSRDNSSTSFGQATLDDSGKEWASHHGKGSDLNNSCNLSLMT